MWDNGLSPANTHVVTPSVDTRYIVSALDANGCFSDDTVDITVNPIPVLALSGAGDYCEGSTVNMTATGADTYSWTGPLGYTSTDQNPQLVSVDSLQTGYYVVTGLNVYGCSSKDSVLITIHPYATAPVVTDNSRCGPGSITFSSSGCNGVTKWHSNQFSSSEVYSGTTFATTNLVATQIYFATCESNYGCPSLERVPVVAEIKEISHADVSPVNSTCLGEISLNNGVILVTGFREGEEYQYSQGTTFDVATAAPATPSMIPSSGKAVENVYNPSGIANYTIRIYSTDGCPVDHTVQFEQSCIECVPYCEPASIAPAN